MEVIIFEKETYRHMMAELRSMVKATVEEAVKETIELSDPFNDWVSADKAFQLLNFTSKNKLTQLRNSGEIEFTQHGRIIKYSKRSINAFLERHKVTR